MPKDDDTPRVGKFTNRELALRLWPLFRPWIPQFSTALLLMMVAQALLIFGPWLIRRAIDVDIATAHRVGLRQTVLLYLLVQITHLVTSYGVRNWLESVGQRMMAALRRQLVVHLMDLPLAFHDRMTPGQLMSRVESDTQALRVLFTTTAVTLLGDILLFVGMFGVMFACSVRLTLVCAIVLPVMGGMTYYFQGKIHPIFVQVRKLNALVASRLTEFLQALPVIQAFARERWAIADFQKRNYEKFSTQIGGEWQILLWWNGVRFLQNISLAIVLGIGGFWSLTGAITVGTLVMFLAYIRRFFQPLQRLSEQLATIQKAFASAERLFVLLGEPQTISEPEASSVVEWPGRGCEVVFENVWFHYGEVDSDDNSDNNSDSEKNAWILKDVSFRIPARHAFAIVGPTGSGKTTMINLLMRFYDPQRGRILIDGIDIRDIRKPDLRQRIGVVMQDIYLFWGDLTKNLTLGGNYSDAAIREAAHRTLSDRFVERLPGGFSAELTERGGNLSVGQRQLLSFTRAILRDPELLILDEATSAVDPATESVIADVTERIMQDRTSIAIAHRLSTIRNADRILVLEAGQIVQQGTPDELREQPGLYRELTCTSAGRGKAMSNLDVSEPARKMTFQEQLSWIKKHWESYHGWLAVDFILTLVNSLIIVAYPMIFKQIIDGGGSAKSGWYFVQQTGLLVLLGVCNFIEYAFLQFYRAKLNLSFEYSIRLRAFEHVTRMGQSFFETFRTGDIVTRLMDDVSQKLSWYLCSGLFRVVEAGAVVGLLRHCNAAD